jgi:hypothetical protein
VSGGKASDAGDGRLLLDAIGRIKKGDGERLFFLLMYLAYEDWETLRPAFERGYAAAAPPKKSRKVPQRSMTRSCINRGMKRSGCSGG